MSISSKGIQSSSVKNWRIHALVFFVFFASLAIIGRLYLLQVIRYQSFVAMAEGQHRSSQKLEAQRGEIFLQDENEPYPLAVNRVLQMAYAVPKEISDRELVAQKLSEVVGMEKSVILEKISNPNDMFEIIKRKLSDEEVGKIKELKLSGVYLEGEDYRYYPAGELASQVVGFVGSDGQATKGMYGLESFWEKQLQGQTGNLSQERDSRGRWISISDRQMQPAKDGDDLVLTINHTVQYEIEKILKETMEKHSADGGTILVMDPKTGRILALANYPSFNPNDYSGTEDISRFLNPAVSLPYESGSVFKTFTEAIGIDTGKISPDTTYVDTGAVQEAGYTMKNSDEKAYGVQTMTQVLEKSLNTGVIFIEKQVGNKVFADYVRRFGFGQKTEIELPGELAGNIKNLDQLKRDINFFTASFGQGITVTPIQLVNGYAAIANGGKLMKPQIVQKIIRSDGSEEEIRPQEIRRVISQQTSNLMGKMLRSVVVEGHGKRADVPGYLVGGKTGTAQVAKAGSKGYEEGLTIGSFAGYAPVNDPQFVVLVKIMNPKDVEWAESSAAPSFGKVMKFLLEYYKVKPTEDPKTSPLANMTAQPIETQATDKPEGDKKNKNKD